MKVVITGANGFVGRSLLHRLVNGKAFGDVAASVPLGAVLEPIAVVRSASSAAALRRSFPGLDVVDVNAGGWEACLRNANAVVHLAWSTVPVSANADPGVDLEANLTGGLRLLEACGRAGIGRFIFVSSGGTLYGAGNGVPHTEVTRTEPQGAYGASKYCFENYLQVRASHYGFGALALRPANLYGYTGIARKDQGVVEQWMDRILHQRTIDVWNGLDVVRDYVFIDDMIDVLVAAIEQPLTVPVLNVGTGVGTSLRDLLELLGGISGSEAVISLRGASPPAVPWNVLDPSLLQRTWNLAPRMALVQGATALWKARATGGEAVA